VSRLWTQVESHVSEIVGDQTIRVPLVNAETVFAGISREYQTFDLDNIEEVENQLAKYTYSLIDGLSGNEK
jgi:hypothetical protein